MTATHSYNKAISKVSRIELAGLPTPQAAHTFQPVPHSRLVDSLEEALALRDLAIHREEYALSPDGMRLFGLLELNSIYQGVRLAIGLTRSHDKSMLLGMVTGYRVLVCDNMMLSGEFKPLLAKHAKDFDLVESLAVAVDRVSGSFQSLRDAIDYKRNFKLSEDQARAIIYWAFMGNRLPVKLMKSVHREFFVQPSYDEFGPSTVWSLENAFTTSFKRLKPVQRYAMTARLGEYLQPYARGVRAKEQ